MAEPANSSAACAEVRPELAVLHSAAMAYRRLGWPVDIDEQTQQVLFLAGEQQAPVSFVTGRVLG